MNTASNVERMLDFPLMECKRMLWRAAIEWIKPLFLDGGRFLNQEGKQVALLGQVYSGEQLDYLPAMMGNAETVVINDLDWQLIPPEDVVAAFQGRRTQLFATANTAADAQVYLEVLNHCYLC